MSYMNDTIFSIEGDVVKESSWPQVETVSPASIEFIGKTEGLFSFNWEKLTENERLTAIQDLEVKMAKLQNRPPCKITLENLSHREFGHFNPETYEITLNKSLLENAEDRLEAIDTAVHEGRHAYQRYAITHPEIHADKKELMYWLGNEIAYFSPNHVTCILGMEYYATQPVELDARDYAAKFMEKFREKEMSYFMESKFVLLNDMWEKIQDSLNATGERFADFLGNIPNETNIIALRAIVDTIRLS